MVKLTVKDMLDSTGGSFVSAGDEEDVLSFSTDTRNIVPGSYFIAIRGKNFDGHDFVAEAIAKGSKGAIVDRAFKIPLSLMEDRIVVVDDTTEAMGKIAACIRGKVKVPVICITGTNGKTTTKEIVAHVLSSKFNVLKSKKSFNNIIGLSLTLFELDTDRGVLVLEVGTNHPGEIAKLAGIAAPTVAVITNIGDGHLEFLGDRRGVFNEKTSLLGPLSDGGVAILNMDDELLAGLAKKDKRRRFFGRAEGSDFRITGIKKTEKGYDFSVNGDRYFLPLEGEHNVYNAAAAIAVARYLGMTPKEIGGCLENVSLPEMRLEKVEAGGVTFINDSYNANPSSFECALKVLGDLGTAGKKGVVAGDMMELGARAKEFHAGIGRSMAEKGVDFVVAIGKYAEDIVNGAAASGMDRLHIAIARDHREAAEAVRRLAGDDAVVLLKGSRSSRMEEVLKCFTTSYTR